MTNVQELERWLTPRQAAAILDLAPSYVSDLFDQGHMRGVRTSAGRLLDPESVQEFAEKRKHAPRYGKGVRISA